MSKKQDVLTQIYERCKARDDFVFTNQEVATIARTVGFGNQHDVTKLDTSGLLPKQLLDDDMFVVHLGKGKHKFVSGIKSGYHAFEDVPETQRYSWPYRRSLLNKVNTSESNTLSMANNQRIIHDFLYEDIAASPKAYGANKTSVDLDYILGSERVRAGTVRVEIDFTMEYLGEVTFFEAKNGESDDFNVFQLFHPYQYFLNVQKERGLAIESVRGCYLVRPLSGGGGAERLRLYLYEFDDPNDPTSIRLVRNAEYTLVQR